MRSLWPGAYGVKKDYIMMKLGRQNKRPTCFLGRNNLAVLRTAVAGVLAALPFVSMHMKLGRHSKCLTCSSSRNILAV